MILAAECTWPVEARLLTDCITDDVTRERHWEGPHPVLDISAVLLAAGMAPCGWFERTEREPEHHPLGDARQSARLLVEALDRCEKGWRRSVRECSDCAAAGVVRLAVCAHPLDGGHGICQEHLDGHRQAERALSVIMAGRWPTYPACPACGEEAGWGGGTDARPVPWCNNCGADQPGWTEEE